MNLTRFLKGLAPALAVAALIGFSAPAPSFADDATPTPAASAPAAAAPRRRALRLPPPLPAPPLRPPPRRAAAAAPAGPPACSATVLHEVHAQLAATPPGCSPPWRWC